MLYIYIIAHAYKGSKFTFIYLISGLLLVSNIALAIAGIDFLLKGTDLTKIYVICIFVYNLTQSVSHLLLAYRYRRIAKECPYTFVEVHMPESEIRCDKIVFKLLLLLNIVSLSIYAFLMITTLDESQSALYILGDLVLIIFVLL